MAEAKTTQNFDIAVVGAGVVGMATALLADKMRMNVILIDKRNPASNVSKRVFTVNAQARNLFEQISIWSKLETVTAVRKMQLYSSKRRNLLLDHRSCLIERLCSTVIEADLVAALVAAVNNSNVKTFYENSIDALEQTKTSVEVSYNNKVSKVDFVVAADGKNSSVAKLVGLDATIKQFDQIAIVANVLMPKVGTTAWQWIREHEILALLPSANGFAGVVWSLRTKNAKEILALTEDQIKDKLIKATDNNVGNCKTIENIQSFPLESHVRELYKKRVVLVGDSAHGYHPLAGQGLNVGLGDIIELLETTNNKQTDLKDMFDSYQRNRQMRLVATKAITDNIANLLEQEKFQEEIFAALLPTGKCFSPLLAELANSR